ncbi:MAG: hypothetical protein J0L72_03230 [Armatimonadetes bacterium]|nr:hypothetical protein [Armatimonadota bacterium]
MSENKPPVIAKSKFRFRKRLAIGVGVVAIAGLWAYSRLEWIPAGYVGVIYNASGGLQQRVYKPQRLWVGPFQTLYLYPTKLQAAIYSQDPNFGEVASADGIQITSSDTATTIFNVAVYYRVLPENVFRAFQAFGTLPIEEIQRQHIRRAMRDAANSVGTQYEVFDLMGQKRQEVSEKFRIELQRVLAPKGITVEHCLLLGATPQGDLDSKITSRVNSYTQLTISRLQSQIAEINRQTAIIRADAESKARNLQATTTKEKSLELLELELQEQAVDAWNGQLPKIQSQPGQTVVITPEALAAMGAKR